MVFISIKFLQCGSRLSIVFRIKIIEFEWRKSILFNWYAWFGPQLKIPPIHIMYEIKVKQKRNTALIFTELDNSNRLALFFYRFWLCVFDTSKHNFHIDANKHMRIRVLALVCFHSLFLFPFEELCSLYKTEENTAVGRACRGNVSCLLLFLWSFAGAYVRIFFTDGKAISYVFDNMIWNSNLQLEMLW